MEEIQTVVINGFEFVVRQATDSLGRKGVSIEVVRGTNRFWLTPWMAKRDAIGAFAELQEQIRDVYAT